MREPNENAGSEEGDGNGDGAWDFNTFNSGSATGKAWLAEFVEGAPRVSVPYRCNRLVLFKSSLLHKTGRARFAAGYLNKRVNLTFLFGRVQAT